MKLVKHYMSRYARQHRKAWKWYSKHIENVNILFDVGANIGIFTLYAASFYPKSIIHSFEPVKDNFDIMMTNINSNNLEKRVFGYNIGFWSEQKDVVLGIPFKKRERNTGLYTFYGTKKLSKKVQMEVMDEWASKHSIYPDFIKIDTEGAEVEILKTSSKCLAVCKYLALEIHPHFSHINKTELIKSLIKQFGFEDPIEVQNNFFFKKTNDRTIT